MTSRCDVTARTAGGTELERVPRPLQHSEHIKARRSEVQQEQERQRIAVAILVRRIPVEVRNGFESSWNAVNRMRYSRALKGQPQKEDVIVVVFDHQNRPLSWY